MLTETRECLGFKVMIKSDLLPHRKNERNAMNM